MDPNDRENSVLAMEVNPVTATDPKFWKWVDQRLDATLGTRPTRSPVMDRGSTSHIDQSFWENLTRVMGSGMGEMLQEQQSQQQTTSILMHRRDGVCPGLQREWHLNNLGKISNVQGMC